MSIRSVLRHTARWLRHAHARRKARLASIQRPDERMVEFSNRLRDDGLSYDTWRHTLLGPWRASGGSG